MLINKFAHSSNRAQNMAQLLGVFVFFVFLMFLNIIIGGGSNYSKMANFDSRTYRNTFWMISGTSKKSTTSGPSDPVLITNIFQKIQENTGASLEYYVSYLRTCNSENRGRYV